jgi:hypothetical protein
MNEVMQPAPKRPRFFTFGEGDLGGGGEGEWDFLNFFVPNVLSRSSQCVPQYLPNNPSLCPLWFASTSFWNLGRSTNKGFKSVSMLVGSECFLHWGISKV